MCIVFSSTASYEINLSGQQTVFLLRRTDFQRGIWGYAYQAYSTSIKITSPEAVRVPAYRMRDDWSRRFSVQT